MRGGGRNGTGLLGLGSVASIARLGTAFVNVAPDTLCVVGVHQSQLLGSFGGEGAIVAFTAGRDCFDFAAVVMALVATVGHLDMFFVVEFHGLVDGG